MEMSVCAGEQRLRESILKESLKFAVPARIIISALL